MSIELFLFILVTVTLLYALVSKQLDSFGLSSPMVFCLVGLCLSGLSVEKEAGQLVVSLIAKVTLLLVLFTDAVHLNFYEVVHNRFARRLLGIGLPLMVLFGAVFAYALFPFTTYLEALLLSLLLAPTDAALGKQVVLDKRVPHNIREALATESGLNDGLVLPFLLGTVAMLKHMQYEVPPLLFLLEQIGFGFLFGAVAGFIGGFLIEMSVNRNWIQPTYQHLFGICLALVSYIGAELLGGNGFIATFVAGLCFTANNHVVQHRLVSFGTSEGEQLSLVTFFIFGAVLLPEAYPHWDRTAFVYALLSLTLIRVGSAYLSLLGTKSTWKEKLFLGWFGPRGLASILYSLLVIQQHLPKDFSYGHSIVVLTVFLSIVLHGLSTPRFIRHIAIVHT